MSAYAVTDKARFSYDANKVFGGFISRDPIRYVADAYRQCERSCYTIDEYIASAVAKYDANGIVPYWQAVKEALAFVQAHPNARQVVKAFRKNAPRTHTESMMARANELEALNTMGAARKNIDSDWADYSRMDWRVARHNARSYRRQRSPLAIG